MSHIYKIVIVISAIALVMVFKYACNNFTAAPAEKEFTIENILPKTPEEKILLGQKININTASADELAVLPSIGPVTAKRITELREKIGGFKAPEDIKKVSGIGDRKYKKIRCFIDVK